MTCSRVAAPLATTDFIAIDQGPTARAHSSFSQVLTPWPARRQLEPPFRSHDDLQPSPHRRPRRRITTPPRPRHPTLRTSPTRGRHRSGRRLWGDGPSEVPAVSRVHQRLVHVCRRRAKVHLQPLRRVHGWCALSYPFRRRSKFFRSSSFLPNPQSSRSTSATSTCLNAGWTSTSGQSCALAPSTLSSGRSTGSRTTPRHQARRRENLSRCSTSSRSTSVGRARGAGS